MSVTIAEQAREAVRELCAAARLRKGDLVVVGCSTSEVRGQKIGSDSAPEDGIALARAVLDELGERGLFLAAQCCEHLNRCLIVEREAVPGAEIVNVVPQPKAGGSFATAAYSLMKDPVAVERVRTAAGLDIGGTLIGMHLREVAVPVRLEMKRIGEAMVLAARTRPKFVGGVRAVYDSDLI